MDVLQTGTMPDTSKGRNGTERGKSAQQRYTICALDQALYLPIATILRRVGNPILNATSRPLCEFVA